MARRQRRYTKQPHLWRRGATGIWYIIWQDGRVPKKRSTRTVKRVEADAALAEFLRDYSDGRTTKPPVTLHVGITDWLEDRERPRNGLHHSTLRVYRRWARFFKAFFALSLLANRGYTHPRTGVSGPPRGSGDRTKHP